MAQVLILMATYNGAKYLAQQMDSILAQSMPDWRLLVRDDGSTDGTVAMLEEYRARDGRIQLLQNKDGERGAFVNFHELIRIAKASDEVYPYYAFSDQDDVWLPNKLERHLESIRAQEKTSPGKPFFLYSNFSYIDGDGNMLEESHGDHVDMRINSKWDLFITVGKTWGCTSMCNRALLDVVQESPGLITHIVMHDNYLASYANIYGESIYDHAPLVLHRLHQNNASRNARIGSVGETITRLFRLEKSYQGLAHLLSHGISTLEDMLEYDPGNAQLRKLKALIEKGGLSLVLFCLHEGVRRIRWDKTIALYCMFLTGGYRKYLIKQDAVKKGNQV